jgi:hypothetical protein
MKFMKLTALLAILILSLLVSSKIHKRKSKKLLKSHSNTKEQDLEVFKRDYYGMCILHYDCGLLSTCNCGDMRVSTDYKYNCSENTKNELEKTKQLERSQILSSIKDLPVDLMKRLMKSTRCSFGPYFPILENMYGRQITSPNRMRIRVVNGFMREQIKDKNFYQIGEDVLVHAAIGKKMDFPFVVNQLNLSQNLLAKSISSGLPNPNSIKTPAYIDDLINDDLNIEKANLYVVKMFIKHIYHQVLYVCAKGKNSAYHFTFDRAMRDHTHENISLRETLLRATVKSNKAFRTLIRVVYYAKSDTCDEMHVPSSPSYSPKMDVVPQ